jgi:hypothetical protein
MLDPKTHSSRMEGSQREGHQVCKLHVIFELRIAGSMEPLGLGLGFCCIFDHKVNGVEYYRGQDVRLHVWVGIVG